MTTSASGWHPDPFGRFEVRYWDGAQWTHHVATQGRQMVDAPINVPPPPATAPGRAVRAQDRKVQRQAQAAGIDVGARSGGGTLFSEPVLVVNQKPKLIAANAEYAVFDQHGHSVGTVREIGQSRLKNAVLPGGGDNGTKRLQILDVDGRLQLALTRPAKLARSKVTVRDADGNEIGSIAQRNLGVVNGARFDLIAQGRKVGLLQGEGRGHFDFSIQDMAGVEVARVSRQVGRGFGRSNSKERDKYVLEIHRDLDGAFSQLVVAVALAIDTALR